ncbi:D-2-hydroxyacid dehydrogenase [Oceanimonas sp. NS1]|uniref:Glycerate dehydrogenase n=1 Tax=Oceanimonas doudoroffii TaxID=84158 RepID=A0A233RBG9_9GAMM|nr:D-2-hydroxyacid dehydrogenase [Oceanimonas doudoroffii]MCT7655137.1 D-2-hydroxyacid dehydrogenase [Oceanimonas sp. NS1]OXY80740.1 glycerate dehydrogenase [Oceanimonas doudoroffii]
MNLVFLDRQTLAPSVNLRRPAFDHHWQEYAETAPEQVVQRLLHAEVAIVNKVKIGAAELAKLPALKLIALAATGSDNVDLAACRAAGVAVCNIRNYSKSAVPEHALSLMMALSRNLHAYRSSVADGRWQQAGQFCYFDYPVRDLKDMTLGLIGYGTIARDLERLVRALGMDVIVAARKGQPAEPGRQSFEHVLAEADVISLHCPLTADTHHLIGEQELAMMKPDALLINVGRGGLVDEEALLCALKEQRIGGAGFDVVSAEPPASNNPLMQALDCPNFILTPHIAWASQAAMQRLADQLVDNIEAFAAGREQNRLV